MRSKSFGERIADVLIEDGLLLPNQLEEAIAIQKSEGGRLLKILTDKAFVTEQDMAFSMGRCLNTPPVNLSKIRIPEDIMALVPRETRWTLPLFNFGDCGLLEFPSDFFRLIEQLFNQKKIRGGDL